MSSASDILRALEEQLADLDYYWGDLDTHGFAILDSLRAIFPSVRSFLMDRETLLLYRELWVEEPEPCHNPLPRLSKAEQEVYEELRCDRLGVRAPGARAYRLRPP